MAKRDILKPLKNQKRIKRIYDFRIVGWLFLILITVLILLFTIFHFKPLHLEKDAESFEFEDLAWLEYQDLFLKDLRGKTILINFWSYTTADSIKYLSYLEEWTQKYKSKGLVVVGIHSSEFEFANNLVSVKEFIENMNISYPIALDLQKLNLITFGVSVLPTTFIINANGVLEHTIDGRNKFGEIEEKIREVLQENGKDLWYIQQSIIEEVKPIGVTRDIYLGYGMNKNGLGNEKQFSPNNNLFYNAVPEKSFNLGEAYFYGSWYNAIDHMEFVGDTEGFVGVRYFGREVNIVAGGNNEVLVLLDGNNVGEKFAGDDLQYINGEGIVKINKNKLYNVIKNLNFGQHTIKFIVKKPFRSYSFSFD